MKSGNIRSLAWSSEVRAERELPKNLNIVALPFFIYHVIKRSLPKKAVNEVKPLAMQCNFTQGRTLLRLCFYNNIYVP